MVKGIAVVVLILAAVLSACDAPHADFKESSVPGTIPVSDEEKAFCDEYCDLWVDCTRNIDIIDSPLASMATSVDKDNCSADCTYFLVAGVPVLSPDHSLLFISGEYLSRALRRLAKIAPPVCTSINKFGGGPRKLSFIYPPVEDEETCEQICQVRELLMLSPEGCGWTEDACTYSPINLSTGDPFGWFGADRSQKGSSFP